MATQLGDVKPKEFNIPDPDITPPKPPDDPNDPNNSNNSNLSNWFIGGLLLVLFYIIYKLSQYL